jgi:hypothetical protein
VGVPASATEQSPEEIHRLVYASVVQHRPIAALSPTGGEGIWRCLSLEKISHPEAVFFFKLLCGGVSRSTNQRDLS